MVPAGVPSPFQTSIDLVLASASRGGFRVALIGGFALPFHGVQRATGDVDFLADAIGADRLVADLTAAGFAVLHHSVELANLKSSRADLAPVDVLFAHRAATRTTSSSCSQSTRAGSTWVCSAATSRYSRWTVPSNVTSTRPATGAPEAPAPDQRQLRPQVAVRSLAEFLRFLEAVEAVHGPTPPPRRVLSGTVFRL